MDVLDAVDKRKSVRSYTGEAIDQDDLDKMLEAARQAPSAKNLQPWKFIVVIHPTVLKDLVSICCDQAFVQDAGAFIIGMAKDKKWANTDLVIAMDHLSLAAVELGYGTCWIGSFDHDALKEKVDLPEDHDVKVCMSIGIPAEEPQSPTKKSIDELVEWIEI